jgi:hypothetical protein
LVVFRKQIDHEEALPHLLKMSPVVGEGSADRHAKFCGSNLFPDDLPHKMVFSFLERVRAAQGLHVRSENEAKQTARYDVGVPPRSAHWSTIEPLQGPASVSRREELIVECLEVSFDPIRRQIAVWTDDPPYRSTIDWLHDLGQVASLPGTPP